MATEAPTEQPVAEEPDLKKPREDEETDAPPAKRQNVGADADAVVGPTGKERQTGTCLRWVAEKGFGFLRQEGSETDIFCHSSSITDGTRVEEGATVTFELVVIPGSEDKPRANAVIGGVGQAGLSSNAAALANGRVTGVVLRWNPKGFGFIQCDQDGEETFVHASAIQDATMLSVGAKVEFDLTTDPQGKRRAEKVTGGTGGPGAAGPANGRLTGKVLRWNERGFGFIQCDQDGEETFCHASAVTDGTQLAEGAMVEFALTTDPSGKRRAEVVTTRNPMMMGGMGYPMGGVPGYPPSPYGMMPQYPPQGYPQQYPPQQQQAYGGYPQQGGYPPQQQPQQQQQPPMPAGYPPQQQQQQQQQQPYAPPAAQQQAAYTAPLADGRSSGVVMRWNERGFGFLKCDQDGEETFVHASAIQNAMSTPATLNVGDRIEFTLTSDPHGKRRAEMVSCVADNQAPPAYQQQAAPQQAYQPQPVYGQAAEAGGWQVTAPACIMCTSIRIQQ